MLTSHFGLRRAIRASGLTGLPVVYAPREYECQPGNHERLKNQSGMDDISTLSGLGQQPKRGQGHEANSAEGDQAGNGVADR